MASENVVHVSKARYDLANNALYEITNISIALRDIIANGDDLNELESTTRGMLARIGQLSEAVSMGIDGPEQSGVDDDTLYRTINCRDRADVEKSHG